MYNQWQQLYITSSNFIEQLSLTDNFGHVTVYTTSSPALAERPHDASFLSVVI